MRIKYAPFIDHVVQLKDATVDLEGNVIVIGDVKGKPATLSLELSEAVKLYCKFKAMDVEGMAKVFGIS